MKTYMAKDGFWGIDEPFREVVVRFEDGREAFLAPRLDLANHSPSGYSWGYAGSGPAQTSLAILADCLGDDRRALALHQRFKFAVIATLSQSQGWTLTQAAVLATVAELEGSDREDRA